MTDIDVTTNKVRLYFFDGNNVWLRMTRFAMPQLRETSDQTQARYSILRNAVMCSIGTVQFFPDQLQILYDSLLDFVDDSGTLLGLESVFLSLHNQMVAVNDDPRVQRGIAIWQNNTDTDGPTSDVDPVVFYDYATKELFLVAQSAIRWLKTGGPKATAISTGSRLTATVQALSSATINNPFMATLAKTRRLVTESIAAAPIPPEAQSWVDGAHAVGGALGIGGVIIGGFVGAAVAVVGGAIAVAPDAAALLADLNAAPSTEVDTAEITVSGDDIVVNDSGVCVMPAEGDFPGEAPEAPEHEEPEAPEAPEHEEPEAPEAPEHEEPEAPEHEAPEAPEHEAPEHEEPEHEAPEHEGEDHEGGGEDIKTLAKTELIERSTGDASRIRPSADELLARRERIRRG